MGRRGSNKASKVPEMATPVSIHGEAACALADAIGCDVETYAVRPGGSRPISTADARAFLAKNPTSEGWSKAIWLQVATDLRWVIQ